jgi:hypothetical protein
MPIAWTIPGTTRTDDLIAHAAKATPGYWSTPNRTREDFKALAAALRTADDAVANWLRMTYVLYADGAWLDQHAKDRGMARQSGESAASLRTRIRQVDPAVTPAAITEIVQAILTANGLPTTMGLVELPRDQMHLGTSTSAIRHCLSRGRRIGSRLPTIIIVLPIGTPAAVVRAVSAAVLIKKAGGVRHYVEPN